MVIFHKCYSDIGSKTLNVNVLVELDNQDYKEGFGSLVSTETIANQAIEESTMFEEVFGKFGKYFSDVDVYSDDEYEGTIEEANKRSIENKAWYAHNEVLYDKDVMTNYNGKDYKCNLFLWIKK